MKIIIFLISVLINIIIIIIIITIIIIIIIIIIMIIIIKSYSNECDSLWSLKTKIKQTNTNCTVRLYTP